MSELLDVEPITDDELLYRRIPVSTGWCDPARKPPIEPEAFRPNKNDITGISLFRAKYTSLAEAARGRPGKSYYVALLSAGNIRNAGMHIEPAPLPDALGHAEIANLTYKDAKTKQAIEWRTMLAENLCSKIEGPFQTPK